IYDVALSDRPERRHMRGVLARVACSDQQLEAWTATLARSPHQELVHHGAALRNMRLERREALVGRIMRELAIWLTPPIAALVDRSDWTPADLRRRATLYLCVDRPDLDRYAVVLRTIIGQTIAALSRDKAMTPGATVTLFLDEAARLGPMGTISRAVDTGAEIGLRPWLFFQNGSEIRTIYPNAEGMIANCAAHCYIEPDAENAQELAMRLGFVKSLFGTDEKPMVAIDELAGPNFADKIIALMRGQAPAKLVLHGDTKAGQRRRREFRAEEAAAYALSPVIRTLKGFGTSQDRMRRGSSARSRLADDAEQPRVGRRSVPTLFTDRCAAKHTRIRHTNGDTCLVHTRLRRP